MADSTPSEHLSDTQFKHKSAKGEHHAKGKFRKGHKSHSHKVSTAELAAVHAKVTQAKA
jgi:hypothetical protein